jgi:endogenous inhibitor of DNA gyrase (YacG/DUF329 family)
MIDLGVWGSDGYRIPDTSAQGSSPDDSESKGDDE